MDPTPDLILDWEIAYDWHAERRVPVMATICRFREFRRDGSGDGVHRRNDTGDGSGNGRSFGYGCGLGDKYGVPWI